ncbi:3-oxoacyl-ACP synthase [Flammeovirgaceae bacterium 311]|nr:3-oxoacyl-ACP synthase [Flammeovirgaceae bacterium 311]
MKIYSVADNIISPLGSDTHQNFRALLRGESAIQKIKAGPLFPEPLYAAWTGDLLQEPFEAEAAHCYTRLEKGFIRSIQAVLDTVPGIRKERLALVISSTKGNIDLLGVEQPGAIGAERLELPAMAGSIGRFFGLANAPVVVSNACISGVSAILVAKKLICMGRYDHVLVSGGDLLDKFILSGFQCLKALSEEPCKPYDADRRGINLGEAVGTMLISKDPLLNTNKSSLALIAGGGQSNDANHISGPSRTGKGLKIAVNGAIKSAGLPVSELGYINAHGTATLFNDEMEAVAFNDLGLEALPLNSLKGYFGHTLGAAGVVESIMTIWQLNHQQLVKSLGYAVSGVSRDLNVLQENQQPAQLQYVLKTGSGFGGCNAAVIYGKAWI